ncbi:MAG: oxidative damage protection protein [Gemmatimonadota bacterium]
MESIQCVRCGREGVPPLARPPFRNALGERIHREICAECWGEWLEHQTLLINHYGLDPREQKAREFLYAQIEEVLLGGGEGMNPAGGGAPEGGPAD